MGGFTILPGAGRIWKATPKIVRPPNPYWYQTARHTLCVNQSYVDYMNRLIALTDSATKQMLEKQMVDYYNQQLFHQVNDSLNNFNNQQLYA